MNKMNYIKNIKSKIDYDGAEIECIWDMCWWMDYPSEEYNGIPSNFKEEYRSVEKIASMKVKNTKDHHIKKLLSDHKRIKRNIEKKLLDSVEGLSVSEIEAAN